MEKRLAVVLIIGSLIAIAAMKPDSHPSTYKTDQQLINDAAKNLAAICDLKPEKCSQQ